MSMKRVSVLGFRSNGLRRRQRISTALRSSPMSGHSGFSSWRLSPMVECHTPVSSALRHFGTRLRIWILQKNVSFTNFRKFSEWLFFILVHAASSFFSLIWLETYVSASCLHQLRCSLCGVKNERFWGAAPGGAWLIFPLVRRLWQNMEMRRLELQKLVLKHMTYC